jgi:hypothetical protein
VGTDRAVRVALDTEGNARVTEAITYRGASARALRAWRRLTADDIRNRVEQMVSHVNSRAHNIIYEVDGDLSLNEPRVTLHLDYDVRRLADVGEVLCSVRPPWLEYEAFAVGRDKRRFPMFWYQPRRDTIQVEISAPPGFVPVASPAPRACEQPPAMLQVTSARSETDATRCQLTYRRPSLSAPVEAYKSLKDCLQTRADVGWDYWVWRQE